MWISLNVIVNFHFTLLNKKKFLIQGSVGEAGSSEAVSKCLLKGRTTAVYGAGEIRRSVLCFCAVICF